MPIIQLSFQFPLNVSIQGSSTAGQGGDILYYITPIDNQGGTNHPNPLNIDTKPKAYGEVISVDHSARQIRVDTTGYPAITLTPDHYLFFSKDRRVNVSGVIGYFAETEYRNYSKLPAEMFATSVNYVESSK